MSAQKFNQTVETIYGKVRGVSRSSNVWQTHMIALDHLLKPQEKPMDVDNATKGLASVQGGAGVLPGGARPPDGPGGACAPTRGAPGLAGEESPHRGMVHA